MSNKIFNKEFFIALAKKYALTSDVLRSLTQRVGAEVVVRGENLERLIELQNKIERLKAMGQDENRCFFTEIPRPSAEEWGDCQSEIAAGNFANEDEYLEEWKIWNPRETNWVEVNSMRCQDYRGLLIRIESSHYLSLSNSSRFLNQDDMKNDTTNQWFVDIIFPYLNELVDYILADVDGFNTYVAQNLPHQLREGRISRRLLNQIVPAEKVCVQDVSTAIEALSTCNQETVSHPLSSMSIRIYCKYYRIAHEAFYGKNAQLEHLDDITYYKKVKLNLVDDIYNVDSEDDFKKFVTDHYGELGLSRLNVFASDWDVNGWKIVVSNSYSAYVDKAIEVATALYKAGTPLYIHSANELLEIINEEGYVRMVQNSYHNHMNHQEEATVFELPWEEECGEDTDNGLTLEQYHKIISGAQWEEVDKVSLMN